MSEFRKNPFTGDWTLYAENRRNRPYEFRHTTRTTAESGKNCPFCGGNEGQTTTPVYQDAADDVWQIRVFPNMFPAVSQNAEELPQETFYERRAGIGRHEVLVDTREHGMTIDRFSKGHLSKVLAVLQERYESILSEKMTTYVQIFKNCGSAAGMSIRHSHSQLIGMPLIPQRIQAMSEKMQERDCLFCKILRHETETGSRVVQENKDFIAFVPYAARFPYELWIAPKKHQSSIAELTAQERDNLSVLLLELLHKVILLRKDIGYNICIYNAPKGKPFHWYMEILPRIGGFAGFEYATNCYINMVLPEEAAEYYRKETERKQEKILKEGL